MSYLRIFGLISLSGWLFVSQSVYGVVVASTLPASRSVQTGELVGVFGTMINAGSAVVTDCRVELASFVDADFYYQIIDPATNWAIGRRNTPVDIEAGQAQSFILGITPNSEISPTEINFSFICANDGPAQVSVGLNTLYFSASNDPVPDIIALAATASGDGIVDLPKDNGFGFFSVATINLGSTAAISVTTDTTGSSVSNALVCETDPVTAACITDLLPTIQTVAVAGSTPTFSIFISSENEVAFDPANNRIAVTFSEAGTIRGSTSVAIRGGGSSLTTIEVGSVDPDCNRGASCDAYQTPCPEGQDCFLVTDAYGGKWVDVEKDKKSSIDDNYCWVAATANILEWSGWGIVDGMETTDDIYRYFQPHWGKDYGEDVYDALEWWFIGDQPDEDYPDGGGFHTSVGFQSYCNSDMSDAYVGPGEMADNPSSIQELLDAGFALGVQLKGDEGGNDGSHVFTIWGYSVETNDPGLMTGVFITNSDDDKNKDNPPDRLYYRQVVFFGDAWHILEEDGSPYKYIKFVYGLSQK